jgi:hypothetical protein
LKTSYLLPLYINNHVILPGTNVVFENREIGIFILHVEYMYIYIPTSCS